MKKITYEDALKRAWDELQERDLRELSAFSFSKLENDIIFLKFIDRSYSVDISQRIVAGEGQRLEPFLSVLVLHYLIGCSSLEPTGELITFREVPYGELYYPAFKSRAIDPLVSKFGTNAKLLLAIGEKLKARRVDLGSAAICVDVFPKLPVVIIIWEGDEEIPPSANILFDRIAPSIMATEDLAVIGNLISSRVRKMCEAAGK
ncbi:MAG: DUF3786 domain-containing protein [Methanomassiliicoccales archaeon]